MTTRRMLPAFLKGPLCVGVLLAAAACSPTLQETRSEPLMVAGPTDSLISNYLSGTFAYNRGEMDRAADFFGALLDDGHTTPSLKLQAINVLASEGRMAEAVPVATRLYDQSVRPLSVVTVLSVDDIARGDYAAALDHLSSLNKSGLSIFISPLFNAWALAGEERFDDALEALAPLKETNGLESLHNLHAALIHSLSGDLETADQFFQQSSNSQGGPSLRFTELYGQFLESQDRHEEAQAVYLNYFRDHPESLYIQPMIEELEDGTLAAKPAFTARDGIAESLFGLASSLRQQNARQIGLLFGRLALHLRPDFPMAQILVAEILEADQRLADARDAYASIPAESTFSWPARLRLAFLYDDLGQTEQAIETLRVMADEQPDQIDPLITLGDVLRSHERYREAGNAYAEALSRVPEVERFHWSLYYALGIALERQKRWEEAEGNFLTALELNPGQPLVLNYLGYSWIEMGMHLERAQAMIEEAVRKRPRDGYIVDSLGWVKYRTGDYEGAVVDLERAVSLRPEDPVINDHLGDAYWKVGRNREARFQWNRALSLEPEDDLRETILQKLDKGLEPVTTRDL